VEAERDELYAKFVKAIHEVQQKSGFKNLLLEKKLGAISETLEKKEAQLNEVLSASNLDPTALSVVTRKLEVRVTGFYVKVIWCCSKHKSTSREAVNFELSVAFSLKLFLFLKLNYLFSFNFSYFLASLS